MPRSRRTVRSMIACLSLIAGAAITASPVIAQEQPAVGAAVPATSLPDLSGLAVIDADHLVAVHDAKNLGEADRPRVSRLTRTHAADGVTWEVMSIGWPVEQGPANDLESASSIPGSVLVLLAESGDDGGDFQRLFLVGLGASDAPALATIAGVTTWPSPATNVEGMAVGRVAGQLLLLWAERAQGEPTTAIQWALLTLDPFAVGEPAAADFTSPAARGPNDRPISAIEVGPDGRVYVASASDPGSDDGPFRSSVWLAGRVILEEGSPTLRMRERPRRLASLDGFKVESLAVVRGDDGRRLILVGTDDEDYGGVLRPLPR